MVVLDLWAALRPLREVALRKDAQSSPESVSFLPPNGNIARMGRNTDSVTHSATACIVWSSTLQ